MKTRIPTTSKAKMPQSKKDLRAQKQRQNVKDGIGDAKGRVASNQKVISTYLAQYTTKYDLLNRKRVHFTS